MQIDDDLLKPFIAELESMGCEDVWIMLRPGNKFGFVCLRNGQIHRHAVTLPEGPTIEDAFPMLLIRAEDEFDSVKIPRKAFGFESL